MDTYSAEDVKDQDATFFVDLVDGRAMRLGARMRDQETQFTWDPIEMQWDLGTTFTGPEVTREAAQDIAAQLAQVSPQNRLSAAGFKSILIHTAVTASSDYTPDERSENASQQVRDRKGRFARAQSKVRIGNKIGTISKIHPATREVTVRTDSGTARVSATHVEVIQAAPPLIGPETPKAKLSEPWESATSLRAQISHRSLRRKNQN